MLKKVLNKNKNYINGIIQVGANKGQELSLLNKYSENIYLFEPLKSIYVDLVKHASRFKNVKTFNFALGSENSSKAMFVSSINNSESSSLLKPQKHLKYFPNIEFKEKEIITLKRFDSIVEEFISNFLILDVQGYELEVLKGFGEKINDIDYIYTEISLTNLYENNVLINDLDFFLNENGFLRIKTRINSNKPFGDAFYVKPSEKNFILMYFYKLKSRIQVSKVYLFLNYIKDLKKIYFLAKQRIKK